ncbi:MAG: hypothetical protein AAGG44_13570, partial [Planctomycetota bacterium]
MSRFRPPPVQKALSPNAGAEPSAIGPKRAASHRKQLMPLANAVEAPASAAPILQGRRVSFGTTNAARQPNLNAGAEPAPSKLDAGGGTPNSLAYVGSLFYRGPIDAPQVQPGEVAERNPEAVGGAGLPLPQYARGGQGVVPSAEETVRIFPVVSRTSVGAGNDRSVPLPTNNQASSELTLSPSGRVAVNRSQEEVPAEVYVDALPSPSVTTSQRSAPALPPTALPPTARRDVIEELSSQIAGGR